MGDRLSQTQSWEKLRLAAAVTILSPNIPLLFMGEEYGETAPFQYFVSHSDETLVEAVREGRRGEFSSFRWKGEIPDPQAEGTFLNSKINLGLQKLGPHNMLYQFYKGLIRLRKESQALSHLGKENMEVKGFEEEKVLYVRRWFKGDEVFYLYNFNGIKVNIALSLPKGVWEKTADSSSGELPGPGGLSEEKIESHDAEVPVELVPFSFVLYRKAGD
jgi:maltooligosyltrehalose trehalohydrolase